MKNTLLAFPHTVKSGFNEVSIGAVFSTYPIFSELNEILWHQMRVKA